MHTDLKNLTGHCKWFNVLKGFGFITPDDSSEDIFAHQSVLQMPGFRSLDAGEHVQVQSYKWTFKVFLNQQG
jgi:cold shock CspA family protein